MLQDIIWLTLRTARRVLIGAAQALPAECAALDEHGGINAPVFINPCGRPAMSKSNLCAFHYSLHRATQYTSGDSLK